MNSKQLRYCHNLALNCDTQRELDTYLNHCQIDHRTILAGKCSVLPIYYFTASKASGKMQDCNGNWY